MIDNHELFMRAALDEAARAKSEGNSGVGSVIVRDGRVVGAGRNLVHTDYDVTAHAETVALRNAGAELKELDFRGSTLYTTFEPCPMCCGAILLAGISTVVIGATVDPATSRWSTYSSQRMIDWLGSSGDVEVITGVLADECRAMHAG